MGHLLAVGLAGVGLAALLMGFKRAAKSVGGFGVVFGPLLALLGLCALLIGILLMYLPAFFA